MGLGELLATSPIFAWGRLSSVNRKDRNLMRAINAIEVFFPICGA